MESMKQRRILVAEDNSVNQLLALALLKKLGHSAHAVASGREAVEALGSGSYDLVLMDCQMPEMDGYEATRVIRRGEKETGKRTPIVALTANAMKEDQKKCFDCGMDDHIPKPLKKERLIEVIARWCPEPTEDPAPVGDQSHGERPPLAESGLGGPYDRDFLLKSLDGDPAAVREVVTLYLCESPEMVNQLGSKVVQKDVKGIQSAAHRLKGAMLAVGAGAAAIVADLEELARTGNVGACRERFNRLTVEAMALNEALIHRELGGVPPASP